MIGKLLKFCELVSSLCFRWAWSDTCCMNQLDKGVQQESLVAMFRWYHGASLTVVHLLGVLSESQELGCLWRSIWNTRGWTYQEYVASNDPRPRGTSIRTGRHCTSLTPDSHLNAQQSSFDCGPHFELDAKPSRTAQRTKDVSNTHFCALRYGRADVVRGRPLDMDQYTRLFRTAQIPTQVQISVDQSSMDVDREGIEGLQDGRERGGLPHCRPQTRTVLYVSLVAFSLSFVV